AVVDCDAGSRVSQDRPIAPHLPHERARGGGTVLEVDADENHALIAIPLPCCQEVGVLHSTCDAPGGPEIDHHDLSAKFREAEDAASIHGPEREVGSSPPHE